MKTYIKKLSNLIQSNIENNQEASFIRLDYFNHPLIYLEVAKLLQAKYADLEIQLSEEKFELWKEEFQSEMEEMKRLGFVSLNQRFTKLRNEFGESKKSVVLLATESVQDTGGLADFYSITPEDMNAKFNKKYAEFFATLDSNDERAVNIINNLFVNIFKHVPVNLLVVSDIADDVETNQLYEIEEITQYILGNLWKYFNLPNILTVTKTMLTELSKGKALKLLDSSMKFIKRDAYKGGLSKSLHQKLLDKFEKFKTEKEEAYLEYLPHIESTFDSYEKYCNDIVDFARGESLDVLRPKLAQFDQTITVNILGIKITSTPPRKEKVKKVYGDPLQAYSHMLIDLMAHLPEISSTDTVTIKVLKVSLAEGLLPEDQVNRWNELCIALGGLVDYLNVEIQNLFELKYDANIDPFEEKDNSKANLEFSKTTNTLSKINFLITTSAYENEELQFEWLFNPYDYWLQSFNLMTYFKEQLGKQGSMELPIFTCNNIGNLLTSTDTSSFHFQLTNTEILLKDTLPIFRKTASSNVEYPNVATKLYKLINPFMAFVLTVSDKGIYHSMNILKSMSAIELVNSYTEVLTNLWMSYNSYPNYEKDHFKLISNLFTIVEEDAFNNSCRKLSGAIIPPFHPAMLEKFEAQQAYIRRGLYIVLDDIANNGNDADIRIFIEQFNRYKDKSAILSGVDTLMTDDNIHHAPSHVLGYYALHGYSKKTQIIDSSYLVEIDVEDEQNDVKEYEMNSSKALIIDSHIKEYIKTFPSSVDSLSLCFVNFEHLYPVIEGIKGYISEQQKQLERTTLNIDILSTSVNYKAQNYMKLWLDETFSVDDNVELNLYFNTYKTSEIERLKDLLEYKSFDLAFVDSLLETEDIKYQINKGKKIAPSEMKYPMVFNPIPAPNDENERRVSISQMQFEASFAHSQLVFWAEHDFARDDELYRVEKVLTVVNGLNDILKVLHEKARWVVSIDTGLDKKIFDSENIISFSTGEGVYGELNVAISASKDMKQDIKVRLESRLRKLFPSWLPDMYSRAADYCLNDSTVLDGIKVLKALNPYDYEIHSYLATLLAVKSLEIEKINDNTLLKTFISLDSYGHWFKDESNRPDLLELEVVVSQDEKLLIKANLVECKMGKENVVHIDKGIQQLEIGHRFLSEKFSKDSTEHDRRYWFAQLYRLLAFSPLYITQDDNSREMLNSDLMKILNGEFNIEWKTTLLTYWLDHNAEEKEIQIHSLNHIDIHHRTYGQLYIQKQLLPEEERSSIAFEDVLNEEYNNFVDDEISFKEYMKNRTKETADEEVDIFVKTDGGTPVEMNPPKPTPSAVDDGQGINIKEDNKDNDQEETKNPEQKLNPDKDGFDNNDENSENKTVGDEDNTGLESEGLTVNDTPPVPKGDSTKISLEEVRVLLGREHRTNKGIYWEYGHPKLENRHLLITGTSGVGKTYFMQCLLLELANKGISTLIFDYTDGFKKSQLNEDFKEALGERIIQFNVQRSGFPINPFKRNMKEFDEDEYDLESEIDVAERISGIFYSVYKKNGIGDQQKNAIYRATLNGLNKYGDHMNLEYLRTELEILDKTSAKTVLSKIEPLIDRKPFVIENLFDWSQLTKSEEGKVYIVQLTGFDRPTQVLITEFILWDIWSYNLSHGNVETPFPVILDEAQNLDQSETSPSARILTEGRKFGWSGLFATQTLQPPITKDAITRFQNASQKVHFLPPEGDNKNIASFLSTESDEQRNWAGKLSKLGKGECVVVGADLLPDGSLSKKNKHVITVTSLNERK